MHHWGSHCWGAASSYSSRKWKYVQYLHTCVHGLLYLVSTVPVSRAILYLHIAIIVQSLDCAIITMEGGSWCANATVPTYIRTYVRVLVLCYWCCWLVNATDHKCHIKCFTSVCLVPKPHTLFTHDITDTCLLLQPLPLVSASRHLVKKGRVIELKQQDKLFGWTSTQRRPVQLFSFNDLVIICKKKKAYSWVVNRW